VLLTIVPLGMAEVNEVGLVAVIKLSQKTAVFILVVTLRAHV
jgi:hypothetical protein